MLLHADHRGVGGHGCEDSAQNVRLASWHDVAAHHCRDHSAQVLLHQACSFLRFHNGDDSGQTVVFDESEVEAVRHHAQQHAARRVRHVLAPAVPRQRLHRRRETPRLNMSRQVLDDTPESAHSTADQLVALGVNLQRRQQHVHAAALVNCIRFQREQAQDCGAVALKLQLQRVRGHDGQDRVGRATLECCLLPLVQQEKILQRAARSHPQVKVTGVSPEGEKNRRNCICFNRQQLE
mmetsp:Transcript_29201/g.67710  ORF Transcript_29201/g.67710 Transcript_29201/m.67710 type:complete len:237 (+) Transcript_29201:1844-2554(+)